jgi:hypothetical protein
VFANNLLVGRVQKKIGQPEKTVEKQWKGPAGGGGSHFEYVSAMKGET